MTGILALLCGAAFGATPLVWSADLEGSDGGLRSLGDTRQWAWGVPTYGPVACATGTTCWGTVLDGFYLNDAEDFLVLPSVDLSEVGRPVLVFQHWYRLEHGDVASLQVDAGAGFQVVEPIYGYPSGSGFTGDQAAWTPVFVDLTGIGDLSGVRLALVTDRSAADAGWYVDDFALYDGDVVPPAILEVGEVEDTDDLEGPYLVEARVVDDVALTSVLLRVTLDEGAPEDLAMTLGVDDTWTGAIPGLPAGTGVVYTVVATDGLNTTVAPEPGLSFRVRLPAPTDLVAPSLAWGASVDLSWTAPESRHAVLGYRVLRDGEPVAESAGTTATAPLVDGLQAFSVVARFDVGEGEPSASVEVEGAVPAIERVAPSEGYQGDQLRIEVVGRSLLLVEGDVTVDLGEGIEVLETVVRDVDTLLATVAIAEDAAAGPRDLVLASSLTEVSLPQAFTLLDGASRPHLLVLEPDELTQGQDATLLVQASEPFVGLPDVRIGTDVVVERVELAAEDTLAVTVVVPYGAAIGEHPVQVDDGSRIFTGLELRVRPFTLSIPSPCGCGAPGSAARAGWLGLLVVLVRRYRERRRPPSTGSEVPRT